MDSLDKNEITDTIEIERIMEMIPHRYPMLMVDRVVDLVVGKSATGIKNVSINEPFFQGHFPAHPVMSGNSPHKPRWRGQSSPRLPIPP